MREKAINHRNFRSRRVIISRRFVTPYSRASAWQVDSIPYLSPRRQLVEDKTGSIYINITNTFYRLIRTDEMNFLVEQTLSSSIANLIFPDLSQFS